MKIGIFGITANPVHIGHINAMKYALKFVDEVWVTLVVNHPFGKKFIDYNLRLEMLKKSLNEFGSKEIKIKELDLEYFNKFKEQIYSYKLLKYLKEKYPQDDFKLIISEDNAATHVWEKFYNYKKIDDEFGKIVCPDVGPHSTNIRELIKENKPINMFVGENVAKFIEQHNLYEMM